MRLDKELEIKTTGVFLGTEFFHPPETITEYLIDGEPVSRDEFAEALKNQMP